MAMNMLHQGALETLYGLPMFVSWLPVRNEREWLDYDQAARQLNNLLALEREKYYFSIQGDPLARYPYLLDLLNHLVAVSGDKIGGIHLELPPWNNTLLDGKLAEVATQARLELVLFFDAATVSQKRLAEIIQNIAATVTLNLVLLFRPGHRDETLSLFYLLMALREDYPFNLKVEMLQEPYLAGLPDHRYVAADFRWFESTSRAFAYAARYSRRPCLPHQAKSWTVFKKYIADNELRRDESAFSLRSCPAQSHICQGLYCVQGSHWLFLEPDGYVVNAACPQASRSAAPLYLANPCIDASFCRVVQCEQPICAGNSNCLLQKFRFEEEALEYAESIRRAASRALRSTGACNAQG